MRCEAHSVLAGKVARPQCRGVYSAEIRHIYEVILGSPRYNIGRKAIKINIITPAEITQLIGKEKLERIVITKDKVDTSIDLDHFIPLFGLSPRLGPIADWGLEIEKNAIKVDTFDYQTNVPGIFAIGDINTYPGKLKLILCGFHEATLMCQSAFKIINPGKKNIFRYTTVSGIDGFDGTRKEAKKPVIQSLNHDD